MAAVKFVALLLLLGATDSCVDYAEPELFYIPMGYVGEVYIIFNVSDGVATELRNQRRIYRIPPSGTLRTQFQPTYGRVSWSFAYVDPSGENGTQIPISSISTIHDTPQNRADTTVEILRYETGSMAAAVPGKPGAFSSNAPCAVKYSRFFVGTKAQYLDYSQRIDLHEYLKRNPVPCESAA